VVTREELIRHWRARFCVRHGDINLEAWEGEGEFLLRQSDVEEFIGDVVDAVARASWPDCLECKGSGRPGFRREYDPLYVPCGCVEGKVPPDAATITIEAAHEALRRLEDDRLDLCRDVGRLRLDRCHQGRSSYEGDAVIVTATFLNGPCRGHDVIDTLGEQNLFNATVVHEGWTYKVVEHRIVDHFQYAKMMFGELCHPGHLLPGTIEHLAELAWMPTQDEAARAAKQGKIAPEYLGRPR
jgi:hypothetical protein